MRFVHLLLALSSLFFMVQANDQQELEVCKASYHAEFRPKLIGLIPRERVYADYEALLPAWHTCQYRCYRCHLTGMTASMERLEKMFLNSEQNGPRIIVTLTRIVNRIDLAFENTCYMKWDLANRLNDTISTFR